MSAARLPAAVRDLFRSAAGSGQDADLLARFVATRDEAAFADLVQRHGGPVRDVCRSVLGNRADADDAFQAVFLTLARRAGQLQKPGSVGAWLHGVAVRVARTARAAAARRQLCEAVVPPRAEVEPADPSWAEVRAVVHEALAALPEVYREPLVACYLRGLTHDDTATELGLSKAAVKKRLERGRDRLRAVLTSRGLGPALVLAVGAAPVAAVPTHLLEAAPRLAAGSGPIPHAILRLVEGGSSMTLTKLAAATILAVIAGFALAAQDDPTRPPTERQPRNPPATDPKAATPKSTRLKEAPPSVATELTGAWTVTWIETSGEALYDAKNHDETLPAPKLVFTADRCTVDGVRVLWLRDFAYKLNPAGTPKEIDATLLDGPKKGETIVGIYIVRGDELRICLRMQRPDLGRPKGFVTNSGTTLYTFILTRGKKTSATQPAELRFDDVLRAGNKLYLVLNSDEGKSFPDELAPFAQRLDLAVKLAERVKGKDLTVVLFRRLDVGVALGATGSWTGFTREQLARYAAEDTARRIDRLAEHAWTLGRLPKDATPLPPEPQQPKSAPPKDVGIYDRVHHKADLPGPGTELRSPKDKNRVYYVTNAMRMWSEPRNAGKHSGLYTSLDGGGTWKLVNTSFEFKTLFVHPTTGDLFAVVEHAWLGSEGADGQIHRYHADKAITSTDGGAKWKDITPAPGRLPIITNFFADPDHPGRACFVANVVRDVIYRPKDDRYSDYDFIRAATPEGERLMERGAALLRP